MPKGSEELTNARKEEIISACEKLYMTMSFKDISIKEIANETSFTRTSIYNYFKTKEEIFLALLQKEYQKWNEDLYKILNDNSAVDKEKFADSLAHSLEKRGLLLKLMTMNHFNMEENSSIERLTEFKKIYGSSIDIVNKCLDKFCPYMSEENKKDFIYTFFPFMYGIYAYVVVSEKQRQAIKLAGVHFEFMSIYEIAYRGIRKMLGL